MHINNIYEKSFVDIPDSRPKIRLPLESVGVSNRPHYITILDPFDRERTITVLGKITILSRLGKNQRGLHMSRFEEILHKLENEQPKTLKKYNKKLAILASKSQESEKCSVNISVNYEKTTKKNISEKPSYELIELYSFFAINKNRNTTRIGMNVPFFNACPCTQRWGMRDYHKYLKSENIDDELIEKLIKNAPLQAHTNKGDLILEIESDDITYKDIYKVLEKSSPIVRELLKGKDEHAFVKEGHKLALFCEDLARKTAYNALERFYEKLDRDTSVRIVVDADESVHFHNLYCEIDTTLRELKSILNNKI